MTKAHMIVTQTPFQLRYRLFNPESKKIIGLTYLASQSIGVIPESIEVSELRSLDEVIEQKEHIKHYSEEIFLTEEDLVSINKIERLYKEGDDTKTFEEIKGLLGILYEKMITPDSLKSNRLKMCFDRS